MNSLKEQAIYIIHQLIPQAPNVDALASSFSTIIEFLDINPEFISWRGSNRPSLEQLADRYLRGYFSKDLPANPGTIPDEMVSVIMHQFYGYPTSNLDFIKVAHQHSMCAENCVGALLERYIAYSAPDWSWCCGSFVKAVDFLQKDAWGNWHLLQIKNRDNTENSSSSAIRNGTTIEKWFRTYSRTGQTNWENLPDSLLPYGLSEEGFIQFVVQHIEQHKNIPN